MFALQYPERVQSLILGCTFCGGPKGVTANPEILATLMKLPKITVEEGFAAMVPILSPSSYAARPHRGGARSATPVRGSS